MATPTKKAAEAVETTSSQSDTDTSLSPAQLAAKRFSLEKPTIDPRDRAWANSTQVDVTQGVANAVPGYDYRYLVTSQYPADGRELHDERQRLVTRGFEPITGPLADDPTAAREYVRDEPTAEIWRRPQEIADDEWRAQLARNVLSLSWAEHYHRRCILGTKPENRWLGVPLEEAMMAHHGLSTRPQDRGQRGQLADRIRSLCRKFRVHPGE
jgi:hypothetical protein